MKGYVVFRRLVRLTLQNGTIACGEQWLHHKLDEPAIYLCNGNSKETVNFHMARNRDLSDLRVYEIWLLSIDELNVIFDSGSCNEFPHSLILILIIPDHTTLLQLCFRNIN